MFRKLFKPSVIGLVAGIVSALWMGLILARSRSHAESALGVPSLQVVAFAGHLKQVPALAGLYQSNYACGGSSKQPLRDQSCEYRTNDIAVRIGYNREVGDLRSVTFETSSNNAPPLAWNALAGVIPWICPEALAAQADDAAAQLADEFRERPWMTHDGITTNRPNRGQREICVDINPQCKIVLVEKIDPSRNYSELYVRSVRLRPKALQSENWQPSDPDKHWSIQFMPR